MTPKKYNQDINGLNLVQIYQKDRNDKRGPNLGTTIMSYKDHLKLGADSYEGFPKISATPNMTELNRPNDSS